MERAPDDDPAMRIFYPYAYTKQNAVRQDNIRFVHYTNADAAMAILNSKTMWMRKTSCMNDYMEVEHGLECLFAAYQGEKGRKFRVSLDNIYDGISNEIGKVFDGWVPHFRTDSYVMCVSEHDNAEDRLGRLSMWRAYSETTGVALVLNNTAFLGPSGSLKVYASPVAYLDDEQFGDELGRIADAIDANQDAVAAFGRDTVTSWVFTAFKFAALCTKHPGFIEEREWRVVYFPKLEKSEHLIKRVETIRGDLLPGGSLG
jgi:Protein of unknown function (DUF2971)